jgi:hypothetical protein
MLARLHCRVWRALIAGDMSKFERLRGELVVAIGRHGLKLDSLVDADAQTMAELLERRNCSKSSSRAFSAPSA